MTALPHIAGGVAIGLFGVRVAESLGVESEPVKIFTALVAAVVSHFVLDAIPHNDDIYRTSLGAVPILVSELIIALSIIFSTVHFANIPFWIVAAGIAGGALPDAIYMASVHINVNSVITAFNNFHVSVHTIHKPALIPNMIFQEIVAFAAFAYVYKF